MWRTNWERVISFLAFPPEIRKVIYSTSAIESLNYQLRKVTRNRASDADGHTTSQAYDANGNPVSATDPEGATASYAYDQRGLVTRVDSPFDGDRTVTEVLGYDGAGNRTLAVSPRGFDAAGGTGPFTDHVTRTAYDGLHRPTRLELPSDAAERTAGQAPAYVHRFYDPAGRVVASSQPTLQSNADLVGDDELTRVDYFDPGWVRRSDDAGDPRVVRYEHIADGRLLRVDAETHPDLFWGDPRRWRQLRRGHPVQVQAARGRQRCWAAC